MRRIFPVLATVGILAAITGLAACIGGGTIEFGAVLPLTGPSAVYGESVRKGVDLAYEQIQAREDLEHEIELTVVDSESDPEKAADLARRLYDQGVLAILGGVTTAEALAMVPVADRADRVLLSPTASSPDLTGISGNFFRVFFSDFKEGIKMGNFASEKMEIGSVVILAKEEPWATGVQTIFKGEFERLGGDVLEVIEFPQGLSDFSGLIERVDTLEPEAVYLAAYARDVAALVEGLRDSGYRGKILTTHAFASPAILEEVGEAAHGILLTAPYFDLESEEEPIRSFADAYEARYGQRPDVWAAHGYDAMMVLVEGIPKPFRTASDFRSGLRAIEDYPGAAGVVRFDEKGDVGKFPRVYQIGAEGLRDYEADIEKQRQELLKKLQDIRDERRRALLQQDEN